VDNPYSAKGFLSVVFNTHSARQEVFSERVPNSPGPGVFLQGHVDLAEQVA
jgi:hypothetical protein